MIRMKDIFYFESDVELLYITESKLLMSKTIEITLDARCQISQSVLVVVERRNTKPMLALFSVKEIAKFCGVIDTKEILARTMEQISGVSLINSALTHSREDNFAM